jgi:plasmid stabilization system protein ParE
VDGEVGKRCFGNPTETVATVVYSARSLDHIERAFQFLRDKNPEAAVSAVAAIQSAVENLAAHPLIGRRIEGQLRELVISYGQTGYIALYRFVVPLDEVRILALRHQRELGYLP